MNNAAQPQFVFAQNPLKPTSSLLLVCHPLSFEAAKDRGRAKVGEYLGLVHGKLPPPYEGMPDEAARTGTAGLTKPASIFKGLHRPMHHLYGTAGSDALVYVTDPPHTYRYVDPVSGVPYLVKEPIKRDSIFTTFVSLDGRHVDEAMGDVAIQPPAEVAGVVLWWEWTVRSNQNRKVPLNSEERYVVRLI